MAQLELSRDINGYNTYSRKPLPEARYSGLLEAATGEQTVTVPTTPYNQYEVIFGIPGGMKVWVAINATAVAPTLPMALTDSVLNPTSYILKAGDVIHMITTDAACEFGVEIYGK